MTTTVSARLKELDISRVVIIDDNPENIKAAQKYSRTVEGAEFEFHFSEQDFLKGFTLRYSRIGLVISDMKMGEDYSGLKVASLSWCYRVPCFIASGGFQHNKNPVIRVVPGEFGAFEGSKDSTESWATILNGILNGRNGKKPHLLEAIVRARKIEFEKPDTLSAYMNLGIIGDCLEVPRNISREFKIAVYESNGQFANAAQVARDYGLVERSNELYMRAGMEHMVEEVRE
jgi:hypothetical protein